MAKQQNATGPRVDATTRVELAVALALTLWVLVLHVVYLFHGGPLWRDEAGTIAFASMPFGEMWDKIQYDNFPPLFHAIARIWILTVSSSDFGFRVLGLIVGVVTIGVIWLSARWLGARGPVLALAFYALNPTALRVGDSMRPYGLGFASVVLTLGLIWKFVETRQRKWFVTAAVGAVFSVQFLYQSAFYIGAFILSGCAILLFRRQRKDALLCFAIGAIAAISLLPHLPNVLKGEQYRDIARVPVSWQLIWQAMSDLLSAPGKMMAPVYVGLFVATMVAGGFVIAAKSRNPKAVYATCVFVIATVIQIGFLINLGLPPRSWYFLIWLAPLMVCADAIWSAFANRVEYGRIAVAVAVALLCVVPSWSGAKVRQTNIDLIAAKLKEDRKPGDLVLAAPWYYGVSLCRYYPQDQFTTLPPMEEIRIHRYDLMKRAMQSADPIGALQAEMERTLRSGHKIWIVGSINIPQPGQAIPQYPPYYKGIGINDAAYYVSWSMKLGKMIGDHALHGDIVTPTAPGEVNIVENLNLIAVSGWHD